MTISLSTAVGVFFFLFHLHSLTHSLTHKEHAANTAVALRMGTDGKTATELLMITADGHDGASALDPTSGINAHQMAYFLRDVLHVDKAMGMDQGAPFFLSLLLFCL